MSEKPTAQGTSAASTARPLRILHVDDMRELCDIVRTSLARDGHTVDICSDGASAVAKIRSNPKGYDVFISDHHMPKMNGIEVVRELRALKYPGKIFIFSSEIDEDVNNVYLDLKVDQVLPKPIILSELRELLANV